MAEQAVLVAPALLRPLVEPLLPGSIDARWFSTTDEAVALAPLADIGWFDEFSLDDRQRAPLAAIRARWINTLLAGLEDIPIDVMRQRGTMVTNGRGLLAGPVADYAVMGVLAMAKRLDEIVRAHDRSDWLTVAPATGELGGSRALIIGMGAIGQAIAHRLEAFDVTVTGVRRTADRSAGVLGSDDWRAQLGAFDWVILATPATDDTRAMIGVDELAAMKREAVLVNIGRGELIDQSALVSALKAGAIGGAFLDVTTPEPLPADHPLWTAPNTLITMHMSGRSQKAMIRNGVERFVRNLRAWLAGDPMESVVDLAKGY